MKIALIGHRGTGKTSIGKALAQRLKFPFYDVDDLVMKRVGKTIAEIVENGGWKTFRALEKEALMILTDIDNGIIATGGGAVLDDGNQKTLAMMDEVVWLKAKVETIMERLLGDATSANNRPPLSGDGLRVETQKSLVEREPIYRRLMSMEVATDGMSVGAIVDNICGLLQQKERGE